MKCVWVTHFQSTFKGICTKTAIAPAKTSIFSKQFSKQYHCKRRFSDSLSFDWSSQDPACHQDFSWTLIFWTFVGLFVEKMVLYKPRTSSLSFITFPFFSWVSSGLPNPILDLSCICPASDRCLKKEITLSSRNSPISIAVSKLAPRNRPAVPPTSAEIGDLPLGIVGHENLVRMLVCMKLWRSKYCTALMDHARKPKKILRQIQVSHRAGPQGCRQAFDP